jgi:hypothetical protein
MSLDQKLTLDDTSVVTSQIQDHSDQIETGVGRLNRTLIAATVLAALTEVIHVFGGGASVWRPVADSALADEPRLVSLAVWHMTSVAMGLSVVALGIAAHPRHAKQSRYLVIFVSLMWIGFGLCFIGTALTEPNGPHFDVLPQPILLLPPGILGLIAIRNRS